MSISTKQDKDTAAASEFDVAQVRRDFPVLEQSVRGKPLVYLDNAATTQKPLAVINRVRDYYLRQNANIHRGVHCLSQKATFAYEKARAKVRAFINAREDREIVFPRGATEAINLVASSYGVPHLGPGDEVLISAMEHHSNIVPWQFACQQTGATLKVIPMNDAGELELEACASLLSKRTKLVGVVHFSNAFWPINPQLVPTCSNPKVKGAPTCFMV